MPPFTHSGLKVWISDDAARVEADNAALYAWAHRASNVWPCSDLADMDSIVADFDSTGLVDLAEFPEGADISGDEFNAFTSDALAAVLSEDHPVWFVAVGQFSTRA